MSTGVCDWLQGGTAPPQAAIALRLSPAMASECSLFRSFNESIESKNLGVWSSGQTGQAHSPPKMDWRICFKRTGAFDKEDWRIR